MCTLDTKINMGHVGTLPAIKNGYVTFGSITRGIRLNDRVVKVWSQILKKFQIQNL